MGGRTRRAPIIVIALALLTACGSPSDTSKSSPEDGPSDGASPSDTRDVITSPPDKSWRDALAAAREAFHGEVTKIELERRDEGGLEYTIELISSDTEYVVQFDADTLEKRSEYREGLGNDADDDQREAFDSSNVIDLNQAAETARQHQTGSIAAWKIEGKDSGRVQYQFDVVSDGAHDDVEVTVDAKTGDVIPDD